MLRQALANPTVLLGILVAAAALLSFPRLGEPCLNGDEAQLAVLARNTLAGGLPRSWDGHNLLTREWGFDSNVAGVWILTPWLPVYVVAASFAVLGSSPLAARLPFALCGLASVIGLYLLVRRRSGDPRLALLSAALLAFNVQFLLFTRSAQWYSLGILWTIAAAWVYTGWWTRGTRPWGLAFGACLALLFYTDCFLSLLVVCGFLAHLVWSGGIRRTDVGLPFAASLLLAALLAAPWFVYVRATGGLPVTLHPTNLGYRVTNPLGGAWEAGEHSLSPLVALGLVGRYLLDSPPRARRASAESLPLCLVAGTFLAFAVLARCSLPALYGYFAHTLPAFAVLAAALLIRCWQASPAGALLLGAALVATNAGEIWLPWICNLRPENRHFAPAQWQSSLAAYLRELACGSRGPVDRLVEDLRGRSRPGDAAFVSFEAEPLIFHTRLRLLREIPFPEPPRFIILRSGYAANYEYVLTRSPVFRPTRSEYAANWQRSDASPVTAAHRQYVLDVLRASGYRSVRLPQADSMRQNCPETRRRYFEVPGDSKEVVLWERSDPR